MHAVLETERVDRGHPDSGEALGVIVASHRQAVGTDRSVGEKTSDPFRIRIWKEYEIPGMESVVYDNGSDQPITRGSIVIHTK